MYSDRLDKLKNVKNSDLEFFTLNNRNAIGKVVNIISPNICCIVLLLDSLVFKFNCKLFNTKINDKSNKLKLIELSTDIENYSDKINISENNTKLIKVYLRNFTNDGFLLVELSDINCDLTYNQILIDEKNLTKNVNNKNNFKFNINY